MSPRAELARALGPQTTALIEQLIEERVKQQRNGRELLTINEYAQRLGRSPGSIRRKVERGVIKSVRVGRSIFVLPVEGQA